MKPEAMSMSAIVQNRYGTEPERVLRLADVDRPIISDDEVLVHVSAASVDMGTVHCMTGMPYAMRLMGFGLRSPKASNPGRAFAGEVESMGKNVDGFALGDAVYGTCDGSFAEYVVVDPKKLAATPGNLSFNEAAAAPISGVTALQAIRKAEVQRGQTVLVVGASGGVGTFAVQIAKALGADVTGVSSAPKADLVRSLGATQVIDYTREDFTDGRRQYDMILDVAGNRPLSHLRRALTPHGRLVAVGVESGGRWIGGLDRSLRAALLSPFVGQHLGMLASTENSSDLTELRQLIEGGHVTPVVDRTFRLAQVAESIAYVRGGHARGKVVIAV